MAEKENRPTDTEAWKRFLTETEQPNAGRRADDIFRDEAHRTLMLTRQGNCIRCHEQPKQLEFKPLNMRGFDLADKPLIAQPPPETPEQAERRMVDKFKRQPIIDQSATILNRLPDKINIEVTKDKVNVSTDFVKAIEAIPGVKLDKEARDYLSKLQAVGFENGKYTMKLDKPISFGIGTIASEISFDVKYDVSKPDGVGLTNVKGLKVLGIEIDDLTVDTSGGKNMVRVGGQLFKRRIEHDIDLNKYNASGELLNHSIGQLAEYKPMLQNRDFGKFTNDVPEGFRSTVSDLLKGVTHISKDGDRYTLKRDNGTATFDFHGPQVSVGQHVSFRIGRDPDRPAVTDITGINFSVPVPEKIGLGSRYIAPIKAVSLGAVESDGGRSIRVDTSDMVESVGVNLDRNFKPRADHEGNWNINVRGKNPLSDRREDKMDINVRIGRDGNVNMRPSEIADVVANMTWQAADLSVTGVSLSVWSAGARGFSWVSSWFE